MVKKKVVDLGMQLNAEQGNRPRDYAEDGERTSKMKYTTEEAKQWDGWGSALKPANEPICLARKPLEKGLTIAENVLKWGTGGINIDGCRVPTDPLKDDMLRSVVRKERESETWKEGSGFKNENNSLTGVRADGRFPANIILDEEAGAALDAQTGELKSGAMTKPYEYKNNGFSLGKPSGSTKQIHESNSGGASRFFYCAKVSQAERNKGVELNNHPTVKPVSLMRYLVKLITPPQGICIDPFSGSGPTGIACKEEDINCICIDNDEGYCKISEARIAAWQIEKSEQEELQGKLFA